MEALRASLPGDRRSAPLSGVVAAGALVRVIAPSELQAEFLSLCTGESRPACGRLMVLGELPAALDRRKLLRLRRRLGVLSQPHGLLSNQTLRDNLQVVIAYGGSPNGRAASERTRRSLEEWGLARWAKLRPGDVPQDVRWRAALLRAAIREPELLIVDGDALASAFAPGYDLPALCRASASSVVLLGRSLDDPPGAAADAVLHWHSEPAEVQQESL